MFTLTDELIENTISSTSGFIVTTVAKNLHLPAVDVTGHFFNSKTFVLLRNKDTGYYWDSIAELIDMFTAELTQERKKSK